MCSVSLSNVGAVTISCVPELALAYLLSQGSDQDQILVDSTDKTCQMFW